VHFLPWTVLHYVSTCKVSVTRTLLLLLHSGEIQQVFCTDSKKFAGGTTRPYCSRSGYFGDAGAKHGRQRPAVVVGRIPVAKPYFAGRDFDSHHQPYHRPSKCSLECLLAAPIRVVNFDGWAAGYTGSSLNTLYDNNDGDGEGDSIQQDIQDKYTDDLTGADCAFFIQGNLVLRRTLEIVESTFQFEGCDLAEKIFLAIMAVNLAGDGDARCLEMVAGSMTFWQVENREGEILVSSTTHVDDDEKHMDGAFEKLATEFEMFRKRNPCPGDAEDAADACHCNGDYKPTLDALAL
jgi:hypothetical protein